MTKFKDLSGWLKAAVIWAYISIAAEIVYTFAY
jgi:hypothetical protein